MAIDGQPLDSNISHEQAISILQKARGLVELVVARSAQGNCSLSSGIRLRRGEVRRNARCQHFSRSDSRRERGTRYNNCCKSFSTIRIIFESSPTGFVSIIRFSVRILYISKRRRYLLSLQFISVIRRGFFLFFFFLSFFIFIVLSLSTICL